MEDYLAADTPRVWVVRPEQQTVTVYTPDGIVRKAGSDALTSADAGFRVEGFSLPVARIFK